MRRENEERQREDRKRKQSKKRKRICMYRPVGVMKAGRAFRVHLEYCWSCSCSVTARACVSVCIFAIFFSQSKDFSLFVRAFFFSVNWLNFTVHNMKREISKKIHNKIGLWSEHWQLLRCQWKTLAQQVSGRIFPVRSFVHYYYGA